MRKKFLPIAIPVLLAIGVAFVLIGKSSPNTEKKTPHYESNTPASEMILAAPPPNVTIDFNFDLSDISSIEIVNNGTDYGLDETSVSENKLAMRRSMKQNAPDGEYLVKYSACWPDGSCHDG